MICRTPIEAASRSENVMPRRLAMRIAVAFPTLALQLLPAFGEGRVARVGYIDAASRKANEALFDAFRAGMRALGWIEGVNVEIIDRWGDGDDARLRGFIAGLIKDGVDVMVTAGNPPTMVARQETSTIPIVLVGVFDPVRLGFVASLARPGGNVTGLSSMAADTTGKQLEVLHETVPTLVRVAVLGNLSEIGGRELWDGASRAAHQLGVDVDLIDVRALTDLDAALQRLQGDYNGFMALGGPLNYSGRTRIVSTVNNLRLPSVYPFRGFASEGGLLSYGTDRLQLFRHAATHVDKILHGQAPANIPVEQPTEFELVINIRTAKALGLTIPASVLARADEIIE
jgi:putative tryptophan/tyrosine transport system substrate-binding protein